MQHQELSVDDHIINFEHLRSEGIRGYGFPAVSISYHLWDVIEMREKLKTIDGKIVEKII